MSNNIPLSLFRSVPCPQWTVGTYVICEVPEIEEGQVNSEKQQGEILSVLYKDQIKHLQNEGLW